MNKYFAYSGAVHLATLAACVFLFAPSVRPPIAMYTIDFLGSSFQSASATESVAQAPATPDIKAPEIKTDGPVKETPKPTDPAPVIVDKKAYAGKTEITKKPSTKKAKISLDAPSVLTDKPTTAKPTASVGSTTTGIMDSGVGIKTDFPDFPYPWYITQVRNLLWSEWQKRKPSAIFTVLVSFSIDKTGAIKNVTVAQKSGSDSYDYAAMSSATNAAPFPPLPTGFAKPQLTVTVEFKDE